MTDERSPDLTQALLLELRAQLEEARRERDEARLAAAQGVKVAEALAAEKAALPSRVAVLEAALRGLSADLDRVLAMRSTLGRTEWLTTIAEKARRALEAKP